jgi:amidophosphoribosyltransferase
MLGELLCTQILNAIHHDLENTVFSYIPNTAETAFLGMMQGIENYLSDYRKKSILDKTLSENELDSIFSYRPRVEKLVIKDAKLRTFITDDEHREDMVSHVYDTTYEMINKGQDTVVVIDDSIVRGTTLEKSILTMLNRLDAKRIVIVSSAPQIRYPDCYGIDMSKLREFVAFRAMLALLKDTNQENLLDSVYEQCVQAEAEDRSHERNFVQDLYAPFTDDEISAKVAQIVKPKHCTAEVEVVFQTVENLHKACPNHSGDWYFTGNYPTAGGNKVVNRAFINFMQGKTVRAY